MTTRTASPTKERKLAEKNRRKENINTTLGFSSREERNQYDRYSKGTSGIRQRPRDRGEMPETLDRSFVTYILDVVDREAGAVTDFSMDAPMDAKPNLSGKGEAGHIYKSGDSVNVMLDGQPYSVTILYPYAVPGRLYYRVKFTNLFGVAITQAQLLKIRILPPVALAPTHLLSAVCPPVPVPVFSYHGATWTGASANRVKERIAQHWQRQIGRMNFESLGWAILV